MITNEEIEALRKSLNGVAYISVAEATDALTAAFAAMPAPAVKVKPLEWNDDGQVSRAKTVIGIYLVRPCLATAHAGQWVLDGVDGQFTLHPSPQAAKAAAQSDYGARINAALERT